MDYSNLEGEEGKGVVKDIRVGVVSVVGNRIVEDVSVPGRGVWFLVSFYVDYGHYNSTLVHALTQDCVCVFVLFSGLIGLMGLVLSLIWSLGLLRV